MLGMIITISVVAVVLASCYFLTPPPYSRTVATNGLSAIIAIALPLLDYLAGFHWQGLLTAQNALVLVLALNVANIFLRTVTTTPRGKRI